MYAIRSYYEAEGIQLDDEVAFFIAKHLRSNVRELEGAVKKVLAYSSFHGREIALDLAKEALKDVIGSVRNIGIDNIQKTVADYYKIKVAELFSKKRTRAIARPRHVITSYSIHYTKLYDVPTTLAHLLVPNKVAADSPG